LQVECRGGACLRGSPLRIVLAYDIVSIAEFPDDESGTAFLLALAAQGNLRTTTLRAYTAEEMTGIIQKLG
jgi:uncharacterized protein with GYD domain